MAPGVAAYGFGSFALAGSVVSGFSGSRALLPASRYTDGRVSMGIGARPSRRPSRDTKSRPPVSKGDGCSLWPWRPFCGYATTVSRGRAPDGRDRDARAAMVAASSGARWAYVFAVMPTSAWPSRLLTATRGTPAANSHDAWL